MRKIHSFPETSTFGTSMNLLSFESKYEVAMSIGFWRSLIFLASALAAAIKMSQWNLYHCLQK